MLSAVAAYYSIAGLTAIFAAAVMPVIIMGATLELGKVVATVWLHNNWERINLAFKLYLIPAVVFLMLLTSMGIFGFLSKAHSDQSLVSGDAMSKVAIYDEKITTEKENIAQAKKAIEQMNSQVDQMLGRSDNERGAERAVSIRKNQAKERAALQAEINKSQKEIQRLQEERAPIAAEFRKVEAEVGPIKYIAALLYGDNPDQNILERAVRWVIILIVVVFDPLALCLILAGNKQIEWARHGKGGWMHEDEAAQNINPNPSGIEQRPWTEEEIAALNGYDPNAEKANEEIAKIEPTEPVVDTPVIEPTENVIDTPVIEPQYQSANPEPLMVIEEAKGLLPETSEPLNHTVDSTDTIEKRANEAIVHNSTYNVKHAEEDTSHPLATEKPNEEPEAPVVALFEVPNEIQTEGVTTEAYRKTYDGYVEFEGKHMAEHVLRDIRPDLFGLDEDGGTGFGGKFPDYAGTGDIFVRTDALPNRVFKFVGSKWIEINKDTSDSYLYNNGYIRYLIDKIGTGEIDPEILTTAEQEAIESFIKNPKG